MVSPIWWDFYYINISFALTQSIDKYEEIMYKVSLEHMHYEASFKSRLFSSHFICINLETQ